MKKIVTLALAVTSVFAASAQFDVLKQAKNAAKTDGAAAEVIKIITPAFTNPETRNLAETWFIPGEASFKSYDHALGMKQLGKLPADGDKKMALNLIDGYKYFKHALPLDSLPNEKGKIKPKFSNKVYDLVAGHLADYVNVGVEVFGQNDYQGAYDLWAAYVEAAQNPAIIKRVAATNAALVADTLVSEIAFNQGIAAWQNNQLQNALDAFLNAKNLGYKKKALYDNAIAVASELKLNDTVRAIAEEAIPLYGAEEPMYLGQVVNYYLQNKQLDKAFDVINQAISLNPADAQYYVIRGVLYENREKDPEAVKAAKTDYEKAISLDPTNAQAKFNYGRLVYEDAMKLYDEAPAKPEENAVYFNEKVKPGLLKAAEIIESSYKLNNDNRDALRYLENIYYQLNDGVKLEEIKALM